MDICGHVPWLCFSISFFFFFFFGGGGGERSYLKCFQRKIYCVVYPNAAKIVWWNIGFTFQLSIPMGDL